MEVLLIDDHPLINSGLASYLTETNRFTVSGQVNTLAEAKRFITEARVIPELIILDIMLGEENGLDFLPFLKSFCLEHGIETPPVLICSVLNEPLRINTALKMGASGYISKTGSKAELLHAIDTVLNGQVYLSEEHTAKIVQSYGLYAQFTKRELEIINLIKAHKTNKQIANVLSIDVRTVENHISNIYFKSGTSTRQDLIKL